MNGFWYMFFGALGMTLIGGALWIVCECVDRKYRKICESANMWSDTYKMADAKRDVISIPGTIGIILTAVFGILAFVFTLIAWLGPLSTKYDVEYFKNKSEYVEVAVQNGDILENLNITHTIIDQNNWLARAKASLNTYGIFSLYYGSGVEELEPIVIERD